MLYQHETREDAVTGKLARGVEQQLQTRLAGIGRQTENQPHFPGTGYGFECLGHHVAQRIIGRCTTVVGVRFRELMERLVDAAAQCDALHQQIITAVIEAASKPEAQQ